ncbi:MAG TPA: flagellar assembly protein FliW [Oscillatoriaceae cyanobacterium]
MQISTRRFGSLEVAPERIIHFPLGLLGFETRQRFVLIDSDQVAPMRWMQSVDDPTLAFLVVDPTLFFPTYEVTLTPEELRVLDHHAGEDVAVLGLVVVPEDPAQMTINLLGPLVLNADKHLGMQVVMHDSGYTARQRLLPDTVEPEKPALV